MKKILIIDDEADILKLLKAIMEKKGYEVTTSLNGQDGLLEAYENKPDLIIVDYTMPQMDGLTFIKECKASDSLKNIPVMILTAHDETEINFMKAGAVNFMTKPFQTKDLLEMVAKSLNPKKKGLFGFSK